MNGSSSKNNNNGRHQDPLGVPQNASPDDVKKVYKAVMAEHPDYGGHPEKFKELAQVFKALSDKEKRIASGKRGVDALSEDIVIGADDAFEIYQSFFEDCWFGGGGTGVKKERLGLDMIIPLEVSLEDLYFGTSRKHFITRNIICSKCNGKGTESDVSTYCASCKGHRVKIPVSGLGPSKIHQLPQVCNECKGRGEKIADEDKCPECKGMKVVQQQKGLEVIVEKGMQNEQKIKFPGLADEAPNKITGDIVFVLEQKEHTTFTRKGDDLIMEHKVSLRECLCGFQFLLTHLDGRKLHINSSPGEFANADSYKVIKNEGMPIYEKPSLRGNLYIHFKVDFPKYVSLDQIHTVDTTLSRSLASEEVDKEPLDKCEETTLRDVHIEEVVRPHPRDVHIKEVRGKRKRKAYNEY